jgi:hypothetical protein
LYHVQYHAVDLDRDASSLVTMLGIMRWIQAWFKRVSC